MKTIKILCCLLVAFATNVFAADLTPAQEKAQRSVYAYLQKLNYDPSVDASDNSVCFRKNGVLYWITFEEESPILYTFHRKAFKVGVDETSYKRESAIVAANEVNRKYKTVKLTVLEKKVDIAIPMYAAKTEDFNAVLSRNLRQFNDIDAAFKSAYANAQDAARKAKENEEQKNVSPSPLRGAIVNASFRLVDAEGNEKTAYDQPLRSFNARFIQTRIEFGPWREKDADFSLHIRVRKPDGNIIYLPGKNYTAEAEITLQKSKKNQMFEVAEFGSTKEGFWKAGEYKVDILDDGDVIFSTSFNIL